MVQTPRGKGTVVLFTQTDRQTDIPRMADVESIEQSSKNCD